MKQTRNDEPFSRPAFRPYPSSRPPPPPLRRPPPPAPAIQAKIDPASIVITKKLPRKKSNFANETAPGPTVQPEPVYQNSTPPVVRERGISIRGAAVGTSSYANGMYVRNGNGGGISIRGESGPATVILSNLDPTANAEDIRVS